jgi:hypothetical protein
MTSTRRLGSSMSSPDCRIIRPSGPAICYRGLGACRMLPHRQPDRTHPASEHSRRQSSTATRYHHGWRAPLPRRKSTKLPANTCGHVVTSPTCISNCWRNWPGPTKCLLLPVESRPSLSAVMAVLSGGLRRAACRSEIAVIESPLRFRIHRPRQS